MREFLGSKDREKSSLLERMLDEVELLILHDLDEYMKNIGG